MPFLLIIIVLFGFFLPNRAFAQTPPALSASPSILQIDLRTESSDSAVYYKNLSQKTVRVALRAQDFNGLDDQGKVNFLDEKDAQNYRYSLSSWVHFETEAFSLNPGEKKTVKLHIDKEKLPVGGHYASLLAEFQEEDTQPGIVSVKGILASLLFVRAGKGYEREEAKLAGFGSNTSFPYFPDQLFFRFQNTGNIQLTPHGLLLIKDMFGRTVAKAIVNDASTITLPESIRRYPLVVTPLTYLLPGPYHAQLSVNYGDKRHVVTQAMTFWSQGSIDGVKLLLLLVIGGIMFGFYRVWKKPFKDS